MPSHVFKTIDRRHLAVVLSKFQSHGGLDIYESGLGFNSVARGATNKDQRATAIITHIFEQPETDHLVLDMLDYLFVTPTYSDRQPDSCRRYEHVTRSGTARAEHANRRFYLVQCEHDHSREKRSLKPRSLEVCERQLQRNCNMGLEQGTKL